MTTNANHIAESHGAKQIKIPILIVLFYFY